METHLYTLCWNEADMLGFFFRHYDPWVDLYFIYDDGSTDGSIEILKSHPKVELRKWERKFPNSFITSQWRWLNTVWQDSKGQADWVVIVDIDEYLFVPQISIRSKLDIYKENGVTLIPALGFEMLSEEFPDAEQDLVESESYGHYEKLMCKVSIFNPDKIEKMNFTSGRHFAKPIGSVNFPSKDELILGHFKNIGFDRTLKKQNALYGQLGTYDTSSGFGLRLASSKEKMREIWDRKMKECFHIVWSDFRNNQYPYAYIWWRPFTQWLGYARNFLRDPLYMLKRLKYFVKNRLIGERIQLYEQHIDQINKNPIRKKLFQLTLDGKGNSEGENSVVVLNDGSEPGNIIQCCSTSSVKELPDIDKFQDILAFKKYNEEKYNKGFKLIAITNSKKFSSKAMRFAKENNIKLVCRKELLAFIASLETD
jgi:hypothetical protein